MDRKYFPINEEKAKQAKAMYSFNDYVMGSTTAEYMEMVNGMYDLADKINKERPDRGADAYKLADRYSKRLADNFNRKITVDLMCPSVMICGPANFPVAKKKKQNQAMDNVMEDYNNVQSMIQKMNNILNGKDVILSDDALAIKKLEEKLSDLEKRQEQMKSVNAYYRKNKTCIGCPLISDAIAKALDKQIETDYEKKPFKTFQLSNNNASIKATRARLDRLKAEKESGTKETKTDMFKIVENTELMRLQLFFDDKPDAETRQLLKSNGFRWAPSNGCWQRQLTNNARYSLKQLIKKMRIE